MKKRFLAPLLAAVLAGSAVGLAGCATVSAWWQNFQSDPVARVQAFEQSVQVVMSIVNAAWTTLGAILPANVLAQATPKYTAAVVIVNDALVALNDAVAAAVAAGTDNPDFTVIMQSISDAIARVVAIVQQFQSLVPVTPDAGTAPRALYAGDLATALISMKHIGGVK